MRADPRTWLSHWASVSGCSPTSAQTRALMLAAAQEVAAAHLVLLKIAFTRQEGPRLKVTVRQAAPSWLWLAAALTWSSGTSWAAGGAVMAATRCTRWAAGWAAAGLLAATRCTCWAAGWAAAGLLAATRCTRWAAGWAAAGLLAATRCTRCGPGAPGSRAGWRRGD